MSASTTPEGREAQDIIDRALKLSPPERERIAHALLDSVYPPDEPEEARKALRAELQRRMDAVDNGTMKTYSIADTMAYLRQQSAERDGR